MLIVVLTKVASDIFSSVEDGLSIPELEKSTKNSGTRRDEDLGVGSTASRSSLLPPTVLHRHDVR